MQNENLRKIKWAAIQPLTGGMYLGAEEAIGNPAEFILSYKGLDGVKYDKSGEKIVDAGNEYNLLEYLKEHNRCPKYYQLDKGMFDSDLNELNPNIYLGDTIETPNYENLDLVVAVPVCAGLSLASIQGTNELKQSRNCNMLWLAKYTLAVIQPKIYIFENAPTFMGSRGDELRAQFEEMAMELGYSVLYYKTDTKLHHNCQSRVRSFIIFYKHNAEGAQNPFMLDWENAQVSIEDFFAAIDNDNLTQNEPVWTHPHNYLVIDFIKQKYGETWTEMVSGSLMEHCIRNNYMDELIEFVKTYDCTEKIRERTLRYINHVIYKRSIGSGHFAIDACLYKKKFPSVMYKTIPNTLHPSGKRICSIREYLTLMGMPSDFTFYGNVLDKIGQNVPAKTAKFIVEQAVKHLANWNETRETETNVIYQDNTKQKVYML